MSDSTHRAHSWQVTLAFGEEPLFKPGERVRISDRWPLGHYRVPIYVRGKSACVEAVIEPSAVNNEEEGFGRNAGMRRHYYRVGVPLAQLWADYAGPEHDSLRIEIFETWLQSI
jgi:hypothetical protein